ncbi:hypothetical protein ACI2KT_19195 [Ensifer adhaerens]|uniref:hypothetical protein n=1 Tax=Ensifer adhaerens TaxID=106592 RepID=UPI00384A48E1
MDDDLSLAEMDDKDLRELCVTAVFWCAEASWPAGNNNAIWFELADEVHRRGWTDTRISFEQYPLN